MKELLTSFAKEHNWKGKNLLLALSGGVDSTAFFHLLLRYHKDLGLSFAVAHVDHGWREESSKEAQKIKEQVEATDISYYQMTLKAEGQSNKEKMARDARYAFFEKIISTYSLDGLILGHHLDDLAETVLKRLLEGASFPYVGGMRPYDKEKGYPIYRPFLSIKKEDIIQWAEEQDFSFFEDKTNQDPAFLRSRMRMHLIPYLNQEFQKNVSKPLSRIAEDSYLLRSYFQQKLKPYMDLFIETPWGLYADCKVTELHPVEYRFILQEIGKRYGLCFGREELKEFAQWLEQKMPNKKYHKKSTTLYFDRGHFLLRKKDLAFEEEILLHEGDCSQGKWRITYRPYQGETIADHWQDWIRGKMVTKIPKGKYKVSLAKKGLSLRENSLYTKLAKRGIPSFLRAFFPVVVEENGSIIPLGIEKKENASMFLSIEIKT